HFKTVYNIVVIFSTIHDVLTDLGDDTSYKDDWTRIHYVLGAFETFEFVFFAHLMVVVLGYTNELSECLQRREQDILNAISLVNMELLSCMSAFNPSNSFASFYAQKVRRLAEFYPNDIPGNYLLKLELQLDNYIDDMRRDDSFQGLDNLVDLSVKLVETKRHKV